MLKIMMTMAIVMSAPWAAAQDQNVKIYTDTYRPYVNPVGEVDGSAMRLVRLVIRNMDLNPDFEHIDYGYGFYATRKSQGDLSFPWLKTAEREEQVLYTVPIYSAQIRLFYNIRFFPESPTLKSLDEKTIGRVINYSYGEQIDDLLDTAETGSRAKTYATDNEAIQALLNGDIDILPQLSSVLTATLNASFQNQNRLIRPMTGVTTLFPNHVIAPKTRQGEALVKAFNESYAELIKAEVIVPDKLETVLGDTTPSDIGEIVTSEGFPVVIGVSRTEPDNSYAIPSGTRVLILDWSDRILAPSNADQLYKTMVDETLVLVLNGPHIGKELRIKNMHIVISK